MTDSVKPEMTSAEAIDKYPAGLQVFRVSNGPWSNVQLSIFSLESDCEQFSMPAISEPMIVWVMSGEATTQERDNGNHKWNIHHVKADSLYVTAGGAKYDFGWKRHSDEPLQVLMLVISQSIFDEALREQYGKNSSHAYLTDYSGIDDPQLISLLQLLKAESKTQSPSKLFIDSVAKAISVHLARQYTDLIDVSKDYKSALPKYRVKQVQDWMVEHLREEFCLSRVAQLVGMSDYHFNRLFKQAVGMPPSQYHIKLRIDVAKRLLRETELNVIDVALEVGYTNASHFARLFRKKTGMTPSHYRRQS
ncbi:AraC family transcriptional regulator [Psychrobacter sp. APC 3281]|uniref:helix-turn-helix domain-containing protein n=1 Tax=unclassified Psychrobacter TaxID=196806 RepID=UPI000C7D4F9E|nr:MULTISPECIES: AraC family transcriptional regulator [unclassified Psychrobacter]MDN3446767.1 AraC family transcriptional regulator [Psychrobacter sp. APC 3281]PKH82294.1 AraC family transcriptional regulator [Psychrobacter sp. 4Bb]